MRWEYSQSNGQIRHSGQVVGRAYSGTGPGRDNPAMDAVHEVGPIPRGRYAFGGPYLNPHCGSQTMKLDPIGRDASHGCVILGQEICHRIAASLDSVLDVVR